VKAFHSIVHGRLVDWQRRAEWRKRGELDLLRELALLITKLWCFAFTPVFESVHLFFEIWARAVSHIFRLAACFPICAPARGEMSVEMLELQGLATCVCVSPTDPSA
jgi:hypothetical protein